jgi:hypothetical protein
MHEVPALFIGGHFDGNHCCIPGRLADGVTASPYSGSGSTSSVGHEVPSVYRASSASAPVADSARSLSAPVFVPMASSAASPNSYAPGSSAHSASSAPGASHERVR